MLPVKKILAPTDFSDASYAAIRQAGELARHFNAELCLLYVVPPLPALPPDPNYTALELPEYEQALHSSAEERLKEILEKRLPEEVKARALTGFGDAAREVVRIAGEEKADMIVISTHGLTGWRHLVFGSVAEKVVRLASCPVLTIRAPRESAPE